MQTRTARAGDVLVYRAELREGQKFARLTLWSAQNDCEEFSPHCDPPPEDAIGDPQMVKAVLHGLDARHRPAVVVRIHVTEPSRFRLVQEIDTHTEVKPILKVEIHGKTRQQLERIARAIAGRVSRGYAALRRA